MAAPIRVLFVGMHWDYGIEARGPSFEHLNFFDALSHLEGVEARELDFLTIFQEHGAERLAAELRATVDEFRPALVFFFLYQDELLPEVLAELRDRTDLLTFNWFADDHWRFDDFSSRYAPLFDAVSTTDPLAVPKYRALGIEPIVTQWAANPRRYAPAGLPLRHDVTFVGQAYGDRPWLVRRLERRGLEVEAWGPGWPSGRLPFEDMVATFETSRINLNLTAASNDPSVPRLVRGVLNRTYPPALRWVGHGRDQVKGRTFEIPACGGFQLSSRCAGIEDCFDLDREIAVFSSPAEMVEQATRFLRDEPARRAIAEAGLRRVLAEHTYEHRFRAIFAALGLT